MKAKIKSIMRFSLLDFYSLYRDYIDQKRKLKKRNRIIDSYFREEGIKKLQIGCGSNFLAGWLNSDLNDIKKEVIFLDAGKPFPFKENSFDVIFSEHLFEHLAPDMQVNFFKESYRTLKVGGVLRISTPDLNFLINLYQEKDLQETKVYLKWAMGQSKLLKDLPEEALTETSFSTYVINNFFKAWGHQLIHDFDSIRNLGLNAGFSHIEKQKVGESRRVELKNVERHGTIIPSRFNELETMVIEFRK